MSTDPPRRRPRPRSAPRRKKSLLRRRVAWFLGIVRDARASWWPPSSPRASTRRCRRSCSRSATRTSSASRRADKDLDPALIAGVIFTESRFRDQTSHAGAKGLMQLLPSTADDIARKSGGTAFVRGRPRQPAGQHLLRLVLPALPAAALRRQRGARDRGLQRRRGARRRVDLRRPPTAARSSTTLRHIPFPETRHYVEQVLEMRGRYRDQYRHGAGALSEEAGRAALVTGVGRREGIGFATASRLVAGRHGGLHAGVGGARRRPAVGRGHRDGRARASPATSRPTSPTPRGRRR